ncbi:DUF2087 domain-containing protein [Liquorilactobacillus mali]|uniref:DUF2087 domain-containing protein n=1 Tax=Liquorilactobacillus mali TaxID=1618 RepID=UPI0003161B27|nr:DUF2087 domain-containing protein [Liquorilactobacillus mali]
MDDRYAITAENQEKVLKNDSEKTVNEILKQYVEDFITMCCYLIEYGILSRKNDGIKSLIDNLSSFIARIGTIVYAFSVII